MTCGRIPCCSSRRGRWHTERGFRCRGRRAPQACYVDTQSHAGAGGKVAQEPAALKLAARTVRVFFEKPHVARVEEHGAVERPVDGEAVFHVELELEGTGLVEVAVADFLRRTVGTGTEGTDGPGADGVGSSDIELLGVWHLRGVAVGVGGPQGHAAYQPVVPPETAVVDKLGLPLDELGEGGAEEFLFAVFAAKLIYGPEKIAGLLDGEGPVQGVVGVVCLVESIGIGQLGDILAHEAQGDRGIHRDDGVEFLGGLHQLGICQLEGGQRVGGVLR